MASVLSGVIHEVGNGFIRLSAGSQIRVSSRVWPEGLIAGARVTIRARLLGAEWVADDIVIEGPFRLVPPPEMDRDAIRAVIRAKLSDGRLPRDSLPRVSGRLGNEQICLSCDRPVPKSHVMIEGSRAGGPALSFHLECFSIWDSERRAK